MPELTTISDAERRRIVHEFVDETVRDAHPEVVAMVRDLTFRVRDTVELARAAGIGAPADRPAPACGGALVPRTARPSAGSTAPCVPQRATGPPRGRERPRTERYFQLLATVNGWTPPPTLTPVLDWFIAALRQHPAP